MEEEEDRESLTNYHTSFPTMMKKAKECSRSKAVATSITTFEDSDSESSEVTRRDILMANALMLKRFDKMILRNTCLEKEKEDAKKEFGEYQEKLNHSEKTIGFINKGKAMLDEVL